MMTEQKAYNPKPATTLTAIGEWTRKNGVIPALLLALAWGVWVAYVGPQQERYDKLLDTVLETQKQQAESIEKISGILEDIDKRTAKWEQR